MKTFFYKLFSLFFKLGRKRKIKPDRVSLLRPHRGGKHDSPAEIKAFLRDTGKYELIEIISPEMNCSSPLAAIKSIFAAIDFFLVKSAKLATSAYVFMNDNFMPMADLDFSDETVITQLWHAEGAFKKFGLSTNLSDEIRKRELKAAEKISFVTCTSENLISIYSEAFGVHENKILPLGSPRIDYLLKERDILSLRKEFNIRHPECTGKKLILYAPTFRDCTEDDSEITSHIDTALFNKMLGNEYALLVKLHPQVHSSCRISGASDVTLTDDIADLTLICDILITDYSSVCFDFCLLGKPCIFYAYDLEKYSAERSFYFEYTDYVPGPVLKNFEEIIGEIKSPSGRGNKNFIDFNFDRKDGGNTERIIRAVMK